MKFKNQQVIIRNGRYAPVVAARRLYIADTWAKRLKGLIFLECLEVGHAILLTPCNSIHTFFMKFPIDILYLDKYMQIIKISPSVPPNKLEFPVLRARHVLEFPAQTITFFNGSVEIKQEETYENTLINSSKPYGFHFLRKKEI